MHHPEFLNGGALEEAEVALENAEAFLKTVENAEA